MERPSMDYKLISQKKVYQGKRLSVEELYYDNQGTKIYREHVLPGDAVVILPITEKEEVIMIQEPRTAIHQVVFGLPAGQLEAGENPEEGAKRELEEETRILCSSYQKNKRNISFSRI